MIRLPPDFKELLRFFHSEEVEYLLVGGYAVAHYGNPRFTNDLDLWVSSDPKNAARVARALVRFGFSAETVREEAFQRPDQLLRMGVPPLQVDLLTSVSGLDFAACYAQRNEVELEGVPVKMIDREHLLQNKRSSGRLKDLADVESLERGSAG